MDFRGGTYISQATASTLKKAIEFWLKDLNINEIQYLSNKSKEYLIKNQSELFEFLNSIDTVQNIWITSFSFKTGTAIIHIIKTDISNEPIN